MWSTENLPEVLFYLERPENPQLGIKPETIIRDDNVVLKKFDVLPDYISVDVDGESRAPLVGSVLISAGWLVHSWRCLDSRISLQDITDRMVEDSNYYGQKLKKPPSNALSNHCYRGCRKILGSYNDYARRDQPHRATVESLEKLSFEKVWMNTVLSRSVEFPDRLVRVMFVRKGVDATGQYAVKSVEVTPENYLDTTFPLDHFCLRQFDPCVVSQLEYDLLPAMSILFDLQKKAELHELAHWKDLPRECLPESWFDRTREGAPEKQTYDGGCEVCTWRPGVDAPSPKAQAFNFGYLRQRNAEKSTAFDLKKAFKNAEEKTDVGIKYERGLKRSRNSRIERDLQRSFTPTASSAMVSRHPSSVPPTLPAKSVKLRDSKRSAKRTAILVEDPSVPELPLAEPLVKRTRYKIKYLEKDDQYNGFWETDTEVEADSDPETVVDLTADVQMLSKTLLPPPSFPNSPPHTPTESPPQNQPLPVEGVTNRTNSYSPLPAFGYFPVDFLNTGYAHNDLLNSDHPYNMALVAGTPPDEPFSSLTPSSSFQSFAPQDHWLASPFSDFDAQDLNLSSNELRGQSMNALLQHSAALHSAMGLNSVQHQVLGLQNQNFGDRPSESGSEFKRHIMDPALIGDLSGYPHSNKHNQLVSTDNPVTPYQHHDKNFSNLIFTDELNRFEGFGHHLHGSAIEESPLNNLGRG